VTRLLANMAEAGSGVPAPARRVIELLAAQLAEALRRIDALEAEIRARHKVDAVSRRLATMPGIGPAAAGERMLAR